MHKTYKFKAIYTETGWISPGYLKASASGKILHISTSPPPGENLTSTENKDGYLLPGFINTHSHSFQYAMTGLAETRTGHEDSFWSWRKSMYELVANLTPDSLFNITKRAYRKLIQSGYTSVVEFHYVHHQKNGTPYEDRKELSLAILKAANETGIQLTLAPVLYQQSYYDKPAEDHQRRFIYKDVDDFLAFTQDLQTTLHESSQSMAIAAHSMRSVEPQNLTKILSQPGIPIHLHCAEQANETRDFVERFKATPAQWLESNVELSHRQNFVHCTHFNTEDLAIFANAKANIILCPTTEANLGDGIFKLHEYHQLEGSWSFGTDSYCGVSPVEELRWAEYVQRLTHQKRNLISARGMDTGECLYSQTIKSSVNATGNEGFLELGTAFNGIYLDSNLQEIEIKCSDLIPKMIFSDCYRDLLKSTIIGGKWYHAGQEAT